MRFRIAVYDPLGADVPIDWLYDAHTISRTRSLRGWPTATIRYPDNGDGHAHFEGPVEIAIERMTGDKTYEEETNSRFLIKSHPEHDLLAEGGVRSYEFIGIGALLDTHGCLMVATNTDKPEDGPVRPVHEWLARTPGKIVKDAIEFAWADGTCEQLETSWQFDVDTAGTPWPGEVPRYSPGVEVSPGAVLRDFEEQGLIEVSCKGRQIRLYVPDTFLARDMVTGRDDAIGFYWKGANGEEKFLREVEYMNACSKVLVLGADGNRFVVNNPSAVKYYGASRRSMNAPWVRTDEEATIAAEPLLRGGKKRQVENRAEINWDAAHLQPDRDFRVGDYINVQRGPTPATLDEALTQGSNVELLRVLEVTETEVGETATGSVTFETTLMKRELRAAQQALRASAGSWLGPTGPSAPPGEDPRKPNPPAAPTITPVLFHDQRNRSRVKFLVSVTPSYEAIDPYTGQVGPIRVERVALLHKPPGTAQLARVATWDDLEVPIVVDNGGAGFDVGEHTFRAKAQAHNGKWSAQSVFTTLTVVADADPSPTPDNVLDAGFRSSLIRLGRKANTTGLDFVADGGRQVAEIVANTSNLNMAVDASGAKGGRQQCAAGDLLMPSWEARHTGASAGSVRVRYRFFDQAGATISTIGSGTRVTTSTWARYSPSNPTTVPAGAVEYEQWIDAPTSSSASPVRVRQPGSARQAITERVADLAIITPKVADYAIIGGPGVGSKIAMRTIYAENIVVGTITANEIRANTITAGQIAAGTITANEIAAGAITAGKIAAGAVTADKIAAGAITADKIAAGAITAGKIQADAINGMTISGVNLIGANIDAIDMDAVVGSMGGLLFNGGGAINPAAGLGTLNDNWQCDGDFEAVTVTETSLRAGKADLRRMPDPRRLLDVPVVTYRRARQTTDPRQVGFTAEDMAAAGLEELVSRDGDGNLRGIRYSRVVAVLTEIVREQEARIRKLES